MKNQSFPINREAVIKAGGNPDKLGCVMLKTPTDVNSDFEMDPSWAYVSNSPERKYVNGYEGTKHVTLLYGLIHNANDIEGMVDDALEDWWCPSTIPMGQPTSFDLEDADGTPYSAIVLQPANEWAHSLFAEANARLSTLPHVRSYSKYVPHLTLGYVKREFKENALDRLSVVRTIFVPTDGLDYGS